MVVFITMNMEGLWNVFSGEIHIDCPGLHCKFHWRQLNTVLNNKLVAGTSIRTLDPSSIMKQCCTE